MDKAQKKNLAVFAALFVIVTAVLVLLMPLENKNRLREEYGKLAIMAESDERARYIIDNIEQYPKSILDLYYNKEDNFDFVYNYPFHKDDYKTMSFTAEELNCETIPALYMDDPRWGYEPFGDDIIKTGGCSLVSMTMAWLYLRHDGTIDPVIVGRFIEDNGYVGMFGGLLRKNTGDVLGGLGFEYTEHNYDENEGGSGTVTAEELKAALDKPGTVVYACMSGETFGEHAMIIRGYDENGFYVNDPASREKTDKVWDISVFENELVRFYEVS